MWVNEMRKFSLEGPFVGLFGIDDDDELLDVSKLPVEPCQNRRCEAQPHSNRRDKISR